MGTWRCGAKVCYGEFLIYGDQLPEGPQGPTGPAGPQGPAGTNGKDGIVAGYATSFSPVNQPPTGNRILEMSLQNLPGGTYFFFAKVEIQGGSTGPCWATTGGLPPDVGGTGTTLDSNNSLVLYKNSSAVRFTVPLSGYAPLPSGGDISVYCYNNYETFSGNLLAFPIANLTTQ